jgi:DNA-binding LytR/AlgR family response regulator
MNALIVEDEDLAARKLSKLLNETAPWLTLQGVTTSVEDTVSWLIENPQPDLIFMDIELADGQSFDIFKKIDVHSRVIFTTSYDAYALQAFKVNSLDYLLKPIQKEDLTRSLNKLLAFKSADERIHSLLSQALNLDRLLDTFQVKTNPISKTYRKRFLVKNNQKLLSVGVSEIHFFYMDERFCFFRTRTNQKFLVEYSIDELVDSLNPEDFFRINRSMIVAHDAIDKIEPYFGSRLALSLKPSFEKEVIVSREKVGSFKNWMGR